MLKFLVNLTSLAYTIDYIVYYWSNYFLIMSFCYSLVYYQNSLKINDQNISK